MRDEQTVAGIIEREFLHALKLRNPLQLAAAAGDAINIVGIRRRRIAQQVKPAAVGGQGRLRYLESALREGVRFGLRRLRVQMCKAGLLRFVPERAVVREPAKLVEAPADPRRVAQA